MNANDTAVRNRLTVDSLSSLIFIKVNGPPPSLFNPVPYTELWLKEGRHASDDKPTGKESVYVRTLRHLLHHFSVDI